MLYIKITVIMLLAVLGSCCSNLNRKSSDPSGTEKTQPAQIMKEQESLSPGTAKILSTVTMFSGENDTLKISVTSVLGYGAATKPIAPGTGLTVIISEEQRGLLKKRDISEGGELKLIVSQVQGMQNREIGWTLVDIL